MCACECVSVPAKPKVQKASILGKNLNHQCSVKLNTGVGCKIICSGR